MSFRLYSTLGRTKYSLFGVDLLVKESIAIKDCGHFDAYKENDCWEFSNKNRNKTKLQVFDKEWVESSKIKYKERDLTVLCGPGNPGFDILLKRTKSNGLPIVFFIQCKYTKGNMDKPALALSNFVKTYGKYNSMDMEWQFVVLSPAYSTLEGLEDLKQQSSTANNIDLQEYDRFTYCNHQNARMFFGEYLCDSLNILDKITSTDPQLMDS